MKTIKICTLLVLLLSVHMINAQSDTISAERQAKFIIKAKPLSILLGGYGLDFEFKLKPRLSLNIDPSVTILEYNDVLNDISIVDITAFQLNPEIRYYLSKSKSYLEGWYTGIGVDYLYALSSNNIRSAEGEKDNEDLHGIGAHAKIGYQWILKNRLTIGLSGGARYNYLIASNEQESVGVRPTLDFSIGYSW